MRFTYEELKLLSRETLIDLLMAVQTLHPEYDTAVEGGKIGDSEQASGINITPPAPGTPLSYRVAPGTPGSWYDQTYDCWYRELFSVELDQLKSGNQKNRIHQETPAMDPLQSESCKGKN